MLPVGAAGTPNIDEMKAGFEIYNKPKNDWSATPKSRLKTRPKHNHMNGSILGLFPAEVAPQSVTNGAGSNNDAWINSD